VPIELIKSNPSTKPKASTTYIPCMNIYVIGDGLNLSLIYLLIGLLSILFN
jgi:hypothetical protein